MTLSVSNSFLPPYSVLSEPKLLFHPERIDDVHVHPLLGLLEFGPFSRSLVNAVLDPIRLAVICPDGGVAHVDELLRELEQVHGPKERKVYLPDFPGFSRVFGLRLVRNGRVTIELDQVFERNLKGAERPHVLLSDQLTKCLSALSKQKHEFDVVLLYLPKDWSKGFVYKQDEDDFDLHDYLKASSASLGVPLQIVREDMAMSYFCRCSVAWRLGIAIYCKAGGVPWKLATSDRETAFIGLSYAVRRTDSKDHDRFVTCCSQVFDSDGAGLEFIAYETADAYVERRNPFLTRSDMRRVMARSLSLYQRRHAGKVPTRIVVHKVSEFKDDEVEGCFDALQRADSVELVQIQLNSMWRGVKIDSPKGADSKGKAAGYPCERGTLFPIDEFETLLWSQGNAANVVGGKAFFKEGKGIPHPLLIRRFAGHGGWELPATEVLGLTKMDWNNDGLYDRLPVTVGYAQTLARIIKRMPQLAPIPYEFRFFM